MKITAAFQVRLHMYTNVMLFQGKRLATFKRWHRKKQMVCPPAVFSTQGKNLCLHRPQGCSVPPAKSIKVVGMGSCGVDYLASVAAYPKPDEKLRTDTLETQGGGNCANALTAAARLGLSPVIVTKVGE